MQTAINANFYTMYIRIYIYTRTQESFKKICKTRNTLAPGIILWRRSAHDRLTADGTNPPDLQVVTITFQCSSYRMYPDTE